MSFEACSKANAFSGFGKGLCGRVTFAALSLCIQPGLSLMLPEESSITCCWRAGAKGSWAGGTGSQARSPCGEILLDHQHARLGTFGLYFTHWPLPALTVLRNSRIQSHAAHLSKGTSPARSLRDSQVPPYGSACISKHQNHVVVITVLVCVVMHSIFAYIFYC